MSKISQKNFQISIYGAQEGPPSEIGPELDSN